MTTQSKTWQRKLLTEAQRDNYTDLFWFVEMELGANRHAPACYPGRFVPVVPVAPDPEITRHWAHMLAELFKVGGNLPSIHFEPTLTSTEALRGTGCHWYEWGSQVSVDVVCYGCGCVDTVDAELLVDSPAWMCERCAE